MLKKTNKLIKKTSAKSRGVFLFSGGLDSIIAAKILLNQGIKVLGLIFKSYFFNEKQAVESAKQIGLEFRVIDFSKVHLKIVKNPEFGRGKNMNPCIDCHLLMFKKAKQIMKKEKFDFVASGEVLGERPMSQNKEALFLIEREAGLQGLILRPLSAKVLPITLPEKYKWVKRQGLQGIKGRARKIQLSLAKQFKIKKFPSPAGGCILTEEVFSNRLGELFEAQDKLAKNDFDILRIGRHFWLDKKIKIVVGRNQEENEKIEKLKKLKDVLMSLKNYPGPTILIRNYSQKKLSEVIIKKAKILLLKYSPKAKNQKDIQLEIVN
ncbi:MAG: tRNA 4-thiouridine(8) synthase ThiI [bacterium]|nr:tRNA 4-thiouridine(8) synthase ThiI [bacterium]